MNIKKEFVKKKKFITILIFLIIIAIKIDDNWYKLKYIFDLRKKTRETNSLVKNLLNIEKIL